MKLNLPSPIEAAVSPLLNELSLDQAMKTVVVAGPTGAAYTAKVEGASKVEAIGSRPWLLAGLWLFVDELEKAHVICQAHEDNPTYNYWHAILHRREGDFSNSHYWFRRVGSHPAMSNLKGYDPHQLIDDAEKGFEQKIAPAEILELQRREWANLFEWCAVNRA
jgi:hypothetical protein